MRYLRQSTASQEILLGPFVAAADGTAMTGLTIANTDIKLLFGGGTSENNKNSGGGTHIAGGRYSAVLDATDTATVGILEVSVNATSAIPWNKSYFVLEEAVYDAFFAASALGYVANAPVNVAQISGDSTAADNLETAFDDTAGAVPWQAIVDQGTAQSATDTTLVLRAGAAFANDELIGATIIITGGSTGVGQSRLITDYVGATDTATVAQWTTNPSGTITYKILGTAAGSGGSGATAQEVWEYSTRELTALDEDNTNIDLNNTTIGTVTTATNVTTVNGLAANVITAAAIAADAGTEIGTAVWASATRELSSNPDVNVVTINGATVQGNGTAGNLWRG